MIPLDREPLLALSVSLSSRFPFSLSADLFLCVLGCESVPSFLNAFTDLNILGLVSESSLGLLFNCLSEFMGLQQIIWPLNICVFSTLVSTFFFMGLCSPKGHRNGKTCLGLFCLCLSLLLRNSVYFVHHLIFQLLIDSRVCFLYQN